MTVYLVGAGPGDPGLLTRRGGALLARADVVLHDRLVSRAILDLAPPSALLVDVGKDAATPAGGAGRQEEIAALLVAHGRAAGVVVRLKGGDPFLFGRGGEEVEALAAAGLAWEVVPGVTSAFGVPAAVGIPVVQRGVAASVTVVTGRVGVQDGTGAHDWEALARVGGTLVILMGMTTRAAIAAALVEGGRAADTPVAVIAQGTTPSQRVARTTLAGLADVDLGPPAVIVVGPVAALGEHGPHGHGPHGHGPHGHGSHGHDSHGHGPDGAAGPPLVGRTVVVTRGGERSGGLVDALERVGATVLEMPLTKQVDAADAGGALRAAALAVGANAWVVLTSVTSVDRFMGALRDARQLGGVLVAAVGPATADALGRAGVEPDLVPAERSARGLVDAFPHAPDAGPRGVLFPAADLAPDTIAEGLGAKGWEVRRVEAYRTVPEAAPVPALLDRVAAADALTFTAPSAVRAFLGLRSAAGRAVTPPAHIVCIGPTTFAAARAAGLAGVHEARDASAAGIVEALIDALGPGPGDAP